jgi:hypothetical protein
MSKKMMLLALSAISAVMFVLPAAASANPPAHIEGLKTLTFEVHATAGSLSTTSGETVKCTTTTGSGKLETTTTGSFSLIFHGCTTETIFGTVSCTTHTPAQPTGTIATTELKFHLFSGATATARPFILVTPNETTKTFAHFTCAGVNKTVEGTGLIGTITAPACDTSSNKATLDFNATAHGIKEHSSLTGVNYTFTSNGTTAAMDTTPTITFKESGFLNCTP